ncbi:RusA family crossover junction endodeoxyribonuclease [Thermomonospora cellulosilytica]|uniref:Holliday junction resolvase RusA-like endonuclease n=1 Tax=Thermomonospora cellulosilytica TaxID=1411118 RepID=A0A7W3N1T5_9ACTN|nr:RusA family crossover junction endodeoxyribonuclease [Thermomonospora cellulosilytica]MBA9005991.1 Holliday junction resolvase RusA-like endonuclease [Thermomonospora cellulosilytica]
MTVPTDLPPREPRLIARFVVDGEPLSKERARVIHRDGKARSYTPDRTTQAEGRVGWAFRQAAGPHRPDPDSAYSVLVTFHPGTRQRRDIDNMLKLVLDALSGIAWADDDQVVHVAADKAAPSPGQARTEVTVYQVGPYQRPTRGGTCEVCQGPTSRETVRRCRRCRNAR